MSNQNKTEEKERIHFDAVVGNPPYQVTKNGNNAQVWQHFVKVANLITNKWTSMIHPGRWVVPTSSMKDIRDDIISQGLEKFNYFPNASEVFPSTNIPTGISITNFKKDYKGDVGYYLNCDKQGTYKTDTLFFSNDFEKEAYEKLNLPAFSKTLFERQVGEEGNLFGYDKKLNKNDLYEKKTNLKDPVAIFCNNVVSKGANLYSWFYIEKSKLNIPKELLNTRKVLISWFGEFKSGFRANAQIIDKKAIGAGYYFLPENDTDYELKLLQSYLCSKTVRFLLSIIMKNNRVKGFENVPDYTYFIDDMKDPKYNNKMFENKLGLLTDEYFYKKFNFSQELINYIESHISAKELV